MAKTANLYARIEPDVKAKAEEILSEIGVPVSSAITMFYKQIILHKGIPFEVKLPKPQNIESVIKYNKLYSDREKSKGSVLSEKQENYIEKTDVANEVLKKLLDETPEKQKTEIINYITYLKLRDERNLYKELLTKADILSEADKISACESSLDFWFNDIDDKEWNDIK